jgi:hypothetical protein
MSTQTIDHNDEDTLQVTRPAALERPTVRLRDMDLDPPSGPVPSDVLAYFEAAVEREGRRRAA